MGPSQITLRLSYEQVNKLLKLDPETGFLYWRIPGRGRQMGRPAGSRDRRGYITLRIDYDRIRAHNIVWLLTHGSWPINELDHINHNTSDNRPENLRDVSASENNFNRKCTNIYGCPGIFKVKGKFRAMYNKTLLGYFSTVEEAIQARRKKELTCQL